MCKPLPVQQSGDNRTPGPPLAHYASVAHVARVYDYLLGGKDNFAADREAAEQAMLINPAVVPTARANQLVRQLVGALAPGSYVVISHVAADIGNGDMAGMASRLNELMAQQTVPRRREQVADLFEGLDLVEPGLVRVPEWRPAMAIDATAAAQMWPGVALKA